MSAGYRMVQWNPQKRRYDLALWLGIALYLACFVGGGLWADPEADAMTLAIRGSATAAFFLLSLILSVGPLARLSPRWLVLLYNRRHMGVSMFALASLHVLLVLLQFHAQGDLPALQSLLSAGWPRHHGRPFPFEMPGLAAWTILLLMAATSHDFWLANLTPPVWKALHMLVYAAYALLCLHVALGSLRQQTDPAYAALLVGGALWVSALHAASAWRERAADRPATVDAEGYVDAGRAADIADGRAVAVTIGAERVAVFRQGRQVCAVSAVCRHQNGPLAEGRIVDGLITCPWHGFQYRPEDGCSPPPFTDKLPTYRTRIRDGRVQVQAQALPPGTPVPPASMDPASADSGS